MSGPLRLRPWIILSVITYPNIHGLQAVYSSCTLCTLHSRNCWLCSKMSYFKGHQMRLSILWSIVSTWGQYCKRWHHCVHTQSSTSMLYILSNTETCKWLLSLHRLSQFLQSSRALCSERRATDIKCIGIELYMVHSLSFDRHGQFFQPRRDFSIECRSFHLPYWSSGRSIASCSTSGFR